MSLVIWWSFSLLLHVMCIIFCLLWCSINSSILLGWLLVQYAPSNSHCMSFVDCIWMLCSFFSLDFPSFVCSFVSFCLLLHCSWTVVVCLLQRNANCLFVSFPLGRTLLATAVAHVLCMILNWVFFRGFSTDSVLNYMVNILRKKKIKRKNYFFFIISICLSFGTQNRKSLLLLVSKACLVIMFTLCSQMLRPCVRASFFLFLTIFWLLMTIIQIFFHILNCSWVTLPKYSALFLPFHCFHSN